MRYEKFNILCPACAHVTYNRLHDEKKKKKNRWKKRILNSIDISPSSSFLTIMQTNRTRR